MSSSRVSLWLEHAWTHERREVEVLNAGPHRRLFVRWEIAGVYTLDLRRNVLLRTPQSRTPLLWRAADVDEAMRCWRHLAG